MTALEQRIFDSLVDGSITEYEDNSVKEFSSKALAYCPNLQKLKLNQIVNIVNEGILYGDTGLFTLELGENFSGFSNGKTFANDGLLSLREIIINNPNRIGTYRSYSHLMKSMVGVGLGILYVPDAQVEWYRNQSNFNGIKIEGLSSYPITKTDFGTVTDSFADIEESELDGTYLSKYSIGDIKTVMIDGKLVDFVIIAFDTDDLSDGSGKAHITWALHMPRDKIAFDTTEYISAIVSRSYNASTMKREIDRLYSTAPQDLKDHCKLVKKSYLACTNKNSHTVETRDLDAHFFAFSRREWHNDGAATSEDHGCSYDYANIPSLKNWPGLDKNTSHGYLLRTVSSYGQAMSAGNSSIYYADLDKASYYLRYGFCT